MKLVDGWRKWYKFWSTRLGIIGTAIASVLIASPNLALDLWSNLPAEFKALIPPNYMPMIGVALFIVSMISKFIVQEKLTQEVKKDDPESN